MCIVCIVCMKIGISLIDGFNFWQNLAFKLCSFQWLPNSVQYEMTTSKNNQDIYFVKTMFSIENNTSEFYSTELI